MSPSRRLRFPLPERRDVVARSRCGFSLVELMIAVLILAIAVCALSSSILSSMVLNRMNRETTLALQGAREVMEQIHGEEFGQAFPAYNATAGDYVGLDAERGPTFDVAGLEPRTGDVDGLVGRIDFPTLSSSGTEELREDSPDAGLGMPRDLDGDGFVTGLDVSGDYRLLPVRIVVQWRGVRGDRELQLSTVLGAQ